MHFIHCWTVTHVTVITLHSFQELSYQEFAESALHSVDKLVRYMLAYWHKGKGCDSELGPLIDCI